jgi:nucleoid DNA-binding protein
MASLNSIFKDILLTHDSITVPGFGTFETSYQSAQLDEKTGVIHPPTKLVKFNQSVKEDTGSKLIKLLAENFKFPEEAAKKMIEDFINSAEAKFKEKFPLTIEEVGILSKDEAGIITLKAVPSSLSIDNYGMDSVEVEKVEEAQRVAIPVATATSTGKTAGKTAKVTTTKVTTTTTTTVKTEEKSEEKKKGGLLKLLTIILPVVAVLTVLFFLFKDNILGENTKGGDKPEAKTEQPSIPETKLSDIEEPETVEIQENITTDSDLSILARAGFSNVSPQYLGTKYKKYYLVGGSFRDKSNANRIKRQIDAKEILKAEGSEYYRVIITGSDDAQEIVDAYQKALSKGIKADDMWLLKNSK